jgi:hypothetical protein
LIRRATDLNKKRDAMSQKFEKLKTLLKELFQLDQPDLDFGLYRIDAWLYGSTEVESAGGQPKVKLT